MRFYLCFFFLNLSVSFFCSDCCSINISRHSYYTNEVYFEVRNLSQINGIKWLGEIKYGLEIILYLYSTSFLFQFLTNFFVCMVTNKQTTKDVWLPINAVTIFNLRRLLNQTERDFLIIGSVGRGWLVWPTLTYSCADSDTWNTESKNGIYLR